jgi:hypothetical protein
MKMEQIECYETSAYKIQTPGKHPEENIQQKVGLFDSFSENTLVWNFMKIYPLWAQLLRADGQTWWNLIVTFHSFASMSKNW